jgi:hypothetical protein
MFRFVHIGFAFPGVPKMRDLEPAISNVGDWIRYSALTWIVWTDKPTTEIYGIIRPRLDAHDQILISAINLTDSFGNLSPWIWAWINSKTAEPSVSYADTLEALLGLAPPKL